jgi:hypothetical protein
MHRTLFDNAYKGGRSGVEWGGADPGWLIRDLAYHVAKLGMAWLQAERGEGEGGWDAVMEHCGDVAVAAMMLWDRAGAQLGGVWPPEAGPWRQSLP